MSQKSSLVQYDQSVSNALTPDNPQAWLTDTIGRNADHKITRLDELMPRRYAQT